MNNKPVLSISIPTYNRAPKLIEALDSILAQDDFERSRVEIIISDNCSTDNTRQVVEKYQKKYNFIKYYKNDINKGIDYNIFRCVELAETDYVYLLSDDDILLKQSVNHMLSLLDNNPDVSFFHINGKGFELNEKGEKVFFSNPIMNVNENIVLNDKNDFVDLVRLQVTFMSAFLLHRDTWNINKNKMRFIGTDIYLSYDLFHLLANSNKYMVTSEPLVGVHAHYTVGNYRIFYAFTYQWRKLLLEEAPTLGFNKKRMRKIFNKSLGHLVKRIKLIKNGTIDIPLDLETLKYLFISTYDTKILWLRLIPALLMPRFIYRIKYLKDLKL
jgi:glycosyltransferase involved in cell wall biosynthesis